MKQQCLCYWRKRTDVKVKNDDEETALHLAAGHKHEASVAATWKNANVDAKNGIGETVLHWLRMEGTIYNSRSTTAKHHNSTHFHFVFYLIPYSHHFKS
jgi:ankyrin repeat protein